MKQPGALSGTANSGTGLQESFRRVVLEALLVPHIFAKDIERFVPRLVGHLEDTGAVASGAREKAAPQAMSGVATGVESDLGREFLDHERDALRRETGGSYRIATVQPPEHGALANPRNEQPVGDGAGRAVGGARHTRDRDDLSLAFLISLGTCDQHGEAFVLGSQMVRVEGDELGATERTCEAEQQQRTVAQTPECLRLDRIDHTLDFIVNGRGLLRGWPLPCATDAAQDLIDFDRVVGRGVFSADMHEADRGEPTAERRRRAPEFRLGGDEQRDRMGRCGQCGEIHGVTPALEGLPVSFVGAPGRGRAAGLGVTGGRIERFLEQHGRECRSKLGGKATHK